MLADFVMRVLTKGKDYEVRYDRIIEHLKRGVNWAV